MRPNGVVLAVLFLFSCGFPVNAATADISQPATVRGIQQLEALFFEHQYKYLPVSPPSDQVFLQPCGIVVPVDWNGFPKKFTGQMYAEMDANGFPLYNLSMYEDPSTRETVFLNTYGSEVYRLSPEKDYNPYAWQVLYFGLSTEYLSDNLLRWIYDPAHVAVRFTLIPEVFEGEYTLLQEQTLNAREDGMAAMALSDPPPPPESTNTPGTNVTATTTNTMVEWYFPVPEGFGRYAEIFQCTNLSSASFWSVIENKYLLKGLSAWSARYIVSPGEARDEVEVRFVQEIQGCFDKIYANNPQYTGTHKDMRDTVYYDGAYGNVTVAAGGFIDLLYGDEPAWGASYDYSTSYLDLFFGVYAQYKVSDGSWTTLKKATWEAHGYATSTANPDGTFTVNGGTESTVITDFSDSTQLPVETPQRAAVMTVDY